MSTVADSSANELMLSLLSNNRGDGLPPLNRESARSAVLTIDLHRGHLDPDVATVPLPPDVSERVVAANTKFLDEARGQGRPLSTW